MISVVIESWNARDRTAPLERLLCTLAPQLGDAELVVTHAGVPERARLERAAGRAITWLALPAAATYHDHKNRGFDATTGEITRSGPSPGRPYTGRSHDDVGHRRGARQSRRRLRRRSIPHFIELAVAIPARVP